DREAQQDPEGNPHGHRHVDASEHRRRAHQQPRADEQQPELRDRGGVDHRTNSGSRWRRCVANPQVIRSIHGNVSAKVTKIASARGMNPSTLSWMEVTVWNMLTRTPATRPARSIGRLTMSASSMA